jgi:hypothetical protein
MAYQFTPYRYFTGIDFPCLLVISNTLISHATYRIP